MRPRDSASSSSGVARRTSRSTTAAGISGTRTRATGFSYRGRGLIQITGRANYAVYGKLLSLDLLGDPDEAAECGTAAAIAAAFWVAHGLNWLADADDLLTITRRINGGLNGLDDRAAALARAKAHLGIAVRR